MFRLRAFLLLVVLVFCLFAAFALGFNLLPASLQTPRVVQIEPAHNATEILPTSPITITFSALMNRTETENAISFTPRLAGNFAWRNDQTLTFTPRSHLPISTTLAINVSQDARSRLRRPLQNGTVSRFTTLARPYIVTSTPALDAQFVYAPDRVTIIFNRAMDANMLADSLMIEPPPQNFSFDVNQHTLTIHGFFESSTAYKITIPAFAFDAEYGIELNREYVWSFAAASQYPNFSILNRGRVLNFSANEPVTIPTQFTNVSRLDVAVYVITQKEFDAIESAPFETWYAFQPGSAPIKTWRISTNAKLDQHARQNLEIGPLARGTYYLKIRAPEGVSDMQVLLID